MTPRRFLDSLLYSYGQILFSNRRWFGAVLLAATFFHPWCGVLGLVGVAISNALALSLKFDTARIHSGFYGFNGVLIGAAYGYYFEPTAALLALFPVFVIITFFVAAALENYFAAAFNLPGLSLPFMLTLYITVIFLSNYDFVTLQTHALTGPTWLGWMPGFKGHYFHALGLILFQPNVLAGMLMAVGLALFSRVLLGLTVAAFLANWLFVTLLLPQQSALLLPLTSLNAVLVAIALGGSLVIPSRKSLVLALLAVLMSVVFTGFFVRLLGSTRLPVMVLPFNLIVLGTLYSLKFRQQSSGLVLLYFAPGSPEENYYHHHTTQARLGRLRYFLCDLPFAGEWDISQGHSGATTHRAEWQYAWDFVVKDEQGRTHSGAGVLPEEYYCYRLPISAPLDGEVVYVADAIPNNPIGQVNLERNWGNTIILKHAEGLYSSLSHLEPGSAKVKEGQFVKRGQSLALCGSSGRSPEPHLHFQFQATAKLGEKSLSYPIGCYVEHGKSGAILRVSEIPPEGAKVQNLVPHRPLREALSFPLGKTFQFECRHGQSEPVAETWEVKVDPYNTLYLESSAEAWANIWVSERVFYVTGFRGNTRSALYHFYLCAGQVPLGYLQGLVWQDELPLSRVLNSPLRYLSELFLIVSPQFRATARLRFAEDAHGSANPVIESELDIRGQELFAAVRKRGQGRLVISSEGDIETFEFSDPGRPEFHARRVTPAAEPNVPELTLREGNHT